MSKRDYLLLLEDLLYAIKKIQEYISSLNFEKFSKDQKTIDAVVRNLEIIGEAARQLPESWKQSHQEIEWYKLSGIRNRIIHEYFGIDLQIIWKVITENLPKLKSDIKKLLK